VRRLKANNIDVGLGTGTANILPCKNFILIMTLFYIKFNVTTNRHNVHYYVNNEFISSQMFPVDQVTTSWMK